MVELEGPLLISAESMCLLVLMVRVEVVGSKMTRFPFLLFL